MSVNLVGKVIRGLDEKKVYQIGSEGSLFVDGEKGTYSGKDDLQKRRGGIVELTNSIKEEVAGITQG